LNFIYIVLWDVPNKISKFDSSISLRGEIRAQKTNLTPSLFIEVAVQSGNIGFNDHPFDRLSLMRSVFIGEKQI
jgi:hypothetical protein